MDVNKMAGWCLIFFGVINVLHEIVIRLSARGAPGFAFALVTAILFTLGAALIIRRPIKYGRK